MIQELHELAYNLWRSWNPAAQRIFQELSPFFWEDSNHNAVEVMNWISGPELKGRPAESRVLLPRRQCLQELRAYMKEKYLGQQERSVLEERRRSHISALNSDCMRVSASTPAVSASWPAIIQNPRATLASR